MRGTIHATNSETSYDQRHQRPYSLFSLVWRWYVYPFLLPNIQISGYVVKKLLFYGNSCLFTTLEKKLWIATPTNEIVELLFFFSSCLFFVSCANRLWHFHFPEPYFLVSANPLIVTPRITHIGRLSQDNSPFTTSIICNVSTFCFCNTMSIEIYFKAFLIALLWTLLFYALSYIRQWSLWFGNTLVISIRSMLYGIE